MTRIRSLVAGIVALVALVGCDHVTKHVAKADLQGHPPRPVIGAILELRYVENTDVACNLMRAGPETTRAPVLLVSGLLGCAILLTLLAWRPRRPHVQAAQLQVAARAQGNTLDRVARGSGVGLIH